MKRRAAVVATGALTLDSILGVSRALGQRAAEPRVVALLVVASETSFATSLDAVRQGLRERGHVEGQDIMVANGNADALARLAAELAALKPAVIIAGGLAANVARVVAPGIPIAGLLADFVETGLAADLGRPSGAVTGISFLGTPLNAKRLELLAQLLAKGSAVLNLADIIDRNVILPALETTGRSLGLVMHTVYARTPTEIETAFTSARRLRIAGVNVLNSPFLNAERARIVDLAATTKLPAIYQWPETARDGGLMGYGPSITAMYRQLAGFASRILNGAKAVDLPIEQPTKFELVINLKAARALGITIPQSLLLRADEVIG